MNPKQLILLIALFFGLAGISETNAQQPDTLYLDINTALKIALSENPTIKVAELEITKKEYAKRSAKGALLPHIDLIGQYQRAIKRQTMYFDGMGSMFGGGNLDQTEFTPQELEILKVLQKVMAPDPNAANEGIQVGRLNSYTGGLNVSLPLVVPSLWKNIQLSEVDIQLAVEQSRSSKINLVNQVKKAYYNALLAKDSYTVFRETYETDSVNLRNIQNKLNQGIVPEYDLITADVRLKSLIPNMLQAENMQKISELQLKMLMGIDGDVPLKIVGSLKDFEEGMFENMVSSDTSLLNNTDLKQFDLQADKAQKAVELQKLQYLPTLTSTFNYMYMSQSNDFKFKNYRWDPSSMLGVSLSIPIFNGGQRHYNVKQAEIQVNQLKWQRMDLQRSLKISVKNNFDLINKNIQQVLATQSAVKQAKKGYDIALKRYETGLGTIVDVNAAGLAVTNAELQNRNAIFDYMAAKADLEKTLGYDY